MSDLDAKGLSIRVFTREDEPMVSQWFRFRDDVLPAESSRGTGYIVSKDGLDLACAFFIQTEADFAIYEFMQTNPKASVYLKARAVRFLTEFMLRHAKNLGFKTLVGFVDPQKKSLQKFFQGIGAKAHPTTLVAKRV